MLEVADNGFADGRYASKEKTLLLFYAKWCPFCRRFLPEFEELSKKAIIPFGKVDISDMDSPLWDAFNIDVVPTAILFEGGSPVERLDGVSGRGIDVERFKEFARRNNAARGI
ncbi:MAG: thioredoxin family protein [Methanomassiliicoccales archaeon]